MSVVKLAKSSLFGEITLPPSKSVTHRALICSFLAGGGNVFPLSESNDMKATKGVLKELAQNSDKAALNCIESGSTLRFAVPLAAALGANAVFTGEGRLPQRPIDEFLRLLPSHGVECESAGSLPLSISGRLESGVYEIAGNVSSQYITGFLLALPILNGDSKIVLTTPLQSKPYVDITLQVMRDYGVVAEETDYGYFVPGNQKYKIRDYSVECDWSQAAFFLAGAAISGDVTLLNMNLNSAQGDKEIISVLKRFGADIETDEMSVRCKKSALKGICVNVENIPDAVPAIAAAAAYASGKTVICGGERLRIKESDRIASVVYNLSALGVDAKETSDGMIIYGGKPLRAAKMKSFNDHRIVMAFSAAALGVNGECEIDGAQSINKTYPSFFDDYNKLGGKANVIHSRE